MRSLLTALLLTLLTIATYGQKKVSKDSVSIAFYNVENLFDTLDDPDKNDDEFTPAGANNWTEDRYQRKLTNLATVISQLGKSKESLPEIVGLVEVENRRVVEDLVKEPKLIKGRYGIMHYESPDSRGIDVAMIYRRDSFQPTGSSISPVRLKDDKSFTTRDILIVSGLLNGESVHFLVNHWPSRRGGESESIGKRNRAAEVARIAVDSILKTDPLAKVILMGDFNDDPNDVSIVKTLKTTDSKIFSDKHMLFNPMAKIFSKGGGTLSYRDKWNLFDQFMVTWSTVNSKKGYAFKGAYIFDAPFLKEQEGQYAGTPFRTYAGKKYLGGYSDHFPVRLILER